MAENKGERLDAHYAGQRMPLCQCGHEWAHHVKDLDNIDVDQRAYCTEIDCYCADYSQTTLTSDAD